MLNITIHGIGMASCALTGRNEEGVQVTFEDRTVQNQFLSWKAFQQLLKMYAARQEIVTLGAPAKSEVEVGV